MEMESKVSNLDQQLKCSPKAKLVAKKKRFFYKKSKLFRKIEIFRKKSKFFEKPNFWDESKFWSKVENLSKHQNLGSKFRLEIKAKNIGVGNVGYILNSAFIINGACNFTISWWIHIPTLSCTVVTGWENELVVWKFWSPNSAVHVTDVEGCVAMLESILTSQSAHFDAVENFTFNMTINWSQGVTLSFVMNGISFMQGCKNHIFCVKY